METLTYIYTLSDPRTDIFYYVGKTITPENRLKGHIKDAKTKRRNNLSCNWVKSLLKEGVEPKMDIIDEVYGEWEWLERYWISQFKTWGFELKNMTNGGDSNPMSNPSSRKKVSDKLKGVSLSKEHKDNVSKAKTGVPIHSEKQKANYSKMNGGINNPMFGKKHSNTTLLKMKIPILQYTLDDDLVREWDSAADVERECGLIAKCINRCAKGDRATAYGYKWVYKNGKGRD